MGNEPLPDKLRNLLCALLCHPIQLLARETHNAKAHLR